MAVPFDFSIGDIIAVGELARKVAKALDESRGATAEIRSLCDVLFSLDRSLEVSSAVFLYSSKHKSPTDAGPLNGMRYELECCKKLMEEFLESAKKYTESLLNGRGSKFRQEWKKISWCLFKAEDVQKLQVSLKGHLDAFDFYASASMRQGVARTEQKTIDISETTRRTEHTVMEIAQRGHKAESMMMEMFGLLKVVQQEMPKVMGHIWEGGDEMTIRLEDALGRAVTLPLLLCGDKESFHQILAIMFKGHPGQKKVARGEYEVSDDVEGALIQGSNWKSKVLPGARITMDIIIKKVSNTRSKEVAQGCPRCNGANTCTIPGKGSLKCRHCELVFRSTDWLRIVQLTEDGLAEDSTSTSNKRKRERDPGEDYAFRRIHYFQEQLKYLKTENRPSSLSAHQKLPPDERNAVTDYQLQLILLEQQNKRRLIMAREEQKKMDSYPSYNYYGSVSSRHWNQSLDVQLDEPLEFQL